MFLHTSMLLSELSAVQNLFYSSLRSTYILTYTLFDLEFRVAKDKLVSSSSSIVLNTTKIVKLTTFENFKLLKGFIYCRILRLKSQKIEIRKKSGREFHSFEAMYEKD